LKEKDTIIMTKQNSVSVPSTHRAVADAAVATWRERDAIAKTKRQAHDSFVSALPPQTGHPAFRSSFSPSDLRSSELHREALEAEDEADRARHTAVAAIHVAELAEGNELAIACDPKHLHGDLVALAAEEQALQDKIKDVQRRRSERMGGAFRSEVEHASRRVAAGLPASEPLPKPRFGGHYLKELAERVEQGVPVPSKAAQIAQCRADERTICVYLEEKRLEKVAQQKEVAARRAEREREAAESNRRMQAQAKAMRDEQAAEARRREQLAADYQARRASGATQ
jgi:hypothetical protein